MGDPGGPGGRLAAAAGRRWALVGLVVAFTLLNGLPLAGPTDIRSNAAPLPPLGYSAPSTGPRSSTGLVGPGAPTAAGTSSWTNLTGSSGPVARSDAAGTFDPGLGGLLLFGGRAADGSALSDTWESSGASWTYLPAADGQAPAARWGAAMSYDSAGGFVLLFGGENGSTSFSDTWIFNATGWHALPGAAGPSARAFAAVAYDPALAGVVVFGGLLDGPAAAVSNETWLFGSAGWIDLTARFVGPSPARFAAAATYDGADGALLMFGGSDSPGSSRAAAGLWRLAGTGWTNLSQAAASAPVPRVGPALAYDSALGAAVLFGGETWSPVGTPLFPNDTWSFRQNAWTNLSGTLAVAPPGRDDAIGIAAPALGGILLVGGDTGTPSAARADIWRFSSQALSVSVTAAPTAGPAPLNVSFQLAISGGSTPYTVTWNFGDGVVSHEPTGVPHLYALAGNFTAGVTVADGSGDSSYQSIPISVLTAWQGAHQWASVGGPGTPAPSPRASAQVAYDPALQAIVLFGGETANHVAAADTWEFVNNLWINLSANFPTAPPARFGGALTYDAVDATLVLFGGSTETAVLNDTWTFDGTGWSPVAAGSAPSARAYPQMAYDTSDGYVVLFGGSSAANPGDATTVSSDTWEFRGGVWVNVTAQLSIAPPPTTGGTFSWDPQDSALVLSGGSSVAAGGAPGTCYPDAQTWAFVGGAWSAPLGPSPTPRMFGMAAYDALDHVVLLYGGSEVRGTACSVSSDSWSYVGGGWSNLSGTIPFPPAARDRGGMAYDAAEGVVVLFGGAASGVLLDDTWVYPSELNSNSTTTSSNTTGNGNISKGPPPGGAGGSGGSGGSGSGGTSPPVAPFAVGYSLSAVASTGPLTVTFVATAVGGVPPFTFSWSFGDSTPTANGSTVSHRYTVTGTFVPVLNASDARGEIVVALLASVHVAPSPTSGLGLVTTGGGSGPSMAEWSIVALAAGSAVLGAAVFAFRRQERRQEQEGEGDAPSVA